MVLVIFSCRIFIFLLQRQGIYIIISFSISIFLNEELKERQRMTLYESWMSKAFSKEGGSVDAIWDEYLPKEQKIYEYILSNKTTKLDGTIAELAKRFSMTAEEIVAFIDGINEVLPELIEMNSLTEESSVELIIDFEKLFKKMVEYKAEHLYQLPAWAGIFDEETRKRFMLEQKRSRTVVKAEKIGRNDLCPCGSGKKYKKCCGAGK